LNTYHSANKVVTKDNRHTLPLYFDISRRTDAMPSPALSRRRREWDIALRRGFSCGNGNAKLLARFEVGKSGRISAPRLPQSLADEPGLKIGEPEVVWPPIPADRNRVAAVIVGAVSSRMVRSSCCQRPTEVEETNI
jgi:hypothetical protein